MATISTEQLIEDIVDQVLEAEVGTVVTKVLNEEESGGDDVTQIVERTAEGITFTTTSVVKFSAEEAREISETTRQNRAEQAEMAAMFAAMFEAQDEDDDL